MTIKFPEDGKRGGKCCIVSPTRGSHWDIASQIVCSTHQRGIEQPGHQCLMQSTLKLMDQFSLNGIGLNQALRSSIDDP